MKSVRPIGFSVVVPSYNRAASLPRALDSILGQTYPAREIIVVDDGSSDGTATMLRRHYAGVRYAYIRHSGVSAARNTGIRLASSEWIALLDSDDCWSPYKLAAQTALIRAQPSLRWVHANERWLRNGRPMQQKSIHEKSGGDIFDACLPRCCVSPSAVVLRRDVFDRFGYFDESFKACEDYEMWLRIAAEQPIGFTDEALVIKHDGHGDQLSRRVAVLDRYRVRALANLLRRGALRRDQAHAATRMLRHKAAIVVAGAKKRGHHRTVERITALVGEFAR